MRVTGRACARSSAKSRDSIWCRATSAADHRLPNTTHATRTLPTARGCVQSPDSSTARSIAVFRTAASDTPAYFILLEWDGRTIALIRDFRYVPYVAEDASYSMD